MSKNSPWSGTIWLYAAWPLLLAGIVFSLASLTSGARGSALETRAAAGTARPDDKTSKDYDADCLRSGCHSALAKTQFVHAPVAVGACASCHEADGGPEHHHFKLVREAKELCSFCHRPKSAAKVIHTAYRDGHCTGCHEPHGGRDRLYLKNDDHSALCAGCHDARSAPPHGAVRERSALAFLHKPVAEGKCTECHESHQSDQPTLLRVAERDLCLKCHESVAAGLGTAAHVHKPLETGCGSCHSGHGGNSPILLRAAPRDVCLGCHGAVLEQTLENGSIHAPVLGDASCLDCHVGHASPSSGLVTPALGAECYRCHAREIILADGGRIPDIKAQVAAAKSVHAPVAKGDCGACHRGHASPHGELLAKSYPLALYAELLPPAVELCFGSCHDARLATAERSSATSFRDGDRNLHFTHTQGKKGRTCALCHEPHASANAGLTRDAVSLGPRGWRVAIGFRTTETGGTCAPGCHQEMSYRNKP